MPRRNVKSWKKNRGPRVWKSKKKYSKKRKMARSKALSPVTGFLPNNKIVKCPYVENITVDSKGGNQAAQLYNFTGCFDPNFSGIGHQSLRYDQLGVYFTTYRVLGAMAITTFRWANLETAIGAQRLNVLCFSLLDDNASSTYTNAHQLQEIYPRNCRILKNDPTASVTLKTFYSPKAFFSLKDTSDTVGLAAAFGTDPTLQAFLRVGVQGLDTNNVTPVVMTTRITYIVKAYQPREIVTS